MRHSTFRLRRAAVSLLVGAGTIGGVIAGVSGAAAAVSTVGSIAVSGTAPAINSTGTNQAAAGLTVTINSGTVIATTGTGQNNYLDLVVTAGAGTIAWTSAPSVSTANINTTANPSLVGTTVVQVPLAAGTLSANATLTFTGIAFTTTGATGTLAVQAFLASSAAAPTAANEVGLFSPTSGVSPATLPATPPTPTTYGLTAASQPGIGIGLSNQAAGNMVLTLSGNANTGWVSGSALAIEVNDTNNHNCAVGTTVTTPDTISVAATPTATVTSTASALTGGVAPTVSVSTGYDGTVCTAANHGSVVNTIIVTFTNSGTLSTTATNAATITLSGIAYDIGAGAAAGPVAVSLISGSTALIAASTTGPTTGPSNAVISSVYVTSNSPAQSVNTSSINASISNVVVNEAGAASLPNGYVCLTLSAGSWDASATPAAAVTPTSGGVALASTTPTLLQVHAANDTLAVDVTGQSTAASAITFSKLGVDAPATSGTVTITVVDGAAAACTGGTTVTSSAVAYTAGGSSRIAGPTADATAAAELESQFPPATAACVGGGSTSNGLGTSRYAPVILATDATYPDALAASYLAGEMGTGVLLTPPTSLSTETLTALRLEGITNVVIVGGPLAVSQAVMTQLQSTPAYGCGGATPLTSLLGTAQNLQVTRIYGQTADQTAAAIAEYPGASNVRSAAFAGAYGMYNDTKGASSSAPSSGNALRTAILATNATFQDAVAASAMAYHDQFPVVLTSPTALSTTTQTALGSLGIQQVIVLGGPLALSDSVVTSLQGMGISVLRIAGQDYTDTAVQLANFEVNQTKSAAGYYEGLGWDPQGTVLVARGDFYTDGLAGAVVAAHASTVPLGSSSINSSAQPILLTENPTTVGSYLTTFLNTAGTTGIDGQGTTVTGTKITQLTILGGTLAVTPAVVSTMLGALAG